MPWLLIPVSDVRVPTAVTLISMVFWDVTQCGLVYMYKCFERQR
jgi:hypothetical protein